MALDGMMMSLVANELRESLVGARVDKIYQPAREELILSLHGPLGNVKLLLCARAAAPRVHLTCLSIENPKQPPMLCMLLRKTIGAARLSAIRQPGFERVLFFDFETQNDMGDPITVTLAAEIMGRYSNLILIGADGRVIDSVKRVGFDKSTVRQILPGMAYTDPPPQVRVAVTKGSKAVLAAMDAAGRDIDVAKLLQETMEGTSPLVAREITHRALAGAQALWSQMGNFDRTRLEEELDLLARHIMDGVAVPTMVLTPDGEPKDFSFLPIAQYQDAMITRSYASLSVLLDAFYGEKDTTERMKQKMSDFSRIVSSRIERAERKLAAQKEELLACRNRDALRIRGDVLSAGLHLMQKGQTSITLENFYAPGEMLDIPLESHLTPVQNVQRYYKEYRRADTAEKMLHSLVTEGEQELVYLDSVWDLMTRARSETELESIRTELSGGGYLRAVPGKRKTVARLAPLRYLSSDGFVILSGRNNLQNDNLTLRESHKNDMWFHVQKQAGSHTIVITEGAVPPDRTLTEAAVIAAVNSRARDSRKVVVDYTEIRNVKKQPGGKPGMVIYEEFKTAIVDPDADLTARLLQND